MSKDKEDKMIMNEIDGKAMAEWNWKTDRVLECEYSLKNILKCVLLLESLLEEQKYNEFTTFLIRRSIFEKANNKIWIHKERYNEE